MARLPNKQIIASAILTALTATQAEAFVSAVSTTPSSQPASLAQSSGLSLVWNVSDLSSPGTSTVSSNAGTFRSVCTTGTVLGSVNRPLSSTKPGSFGTVVHNVAESLLVPPDVTFRANKLGLSSLFYERTWGGVTNCLRVDVVSSAGAGFGIGRMGLSFDNGAPVRVLGRREALRANAEISFNGTGLLQGAWEIAGPTSTAGEPIFRPLATVRQPLFGSETQRLASPLLPTDSAGLYLVRLRITDPAPGFDIPVVRYFVADERTGARLPALSLALVTPPNQSLLTGDTTFVWEGIRGARAYQLEIYLKPSTTADGLPDLGGEPMNTAPTSVPSTPPTTGMLVSGAQTRTILSSAARSHLIAGRTYVWRVLAIGGDGSVVGESPARELRMP